MTFKTKIIAGAALIAISMVDVNAMNINVDINIINRISNACVTGDIATVRAFLHSGYIDFPNSNGETFLVQAIIAGQLEIVELLIKRGADVNMPSCGVTPLMAAAEKGSLKIVDLILQNGCTSINKTSQFGKRTALIYSIANGHNDIMERLLEKKADITTYARKNTVLMCAKNVAAAQRLLDVDATLINKMNEENRTPLINAILSGKYDIAIFFIEKNADVYAIDKFGFDALMVAVKRKNTEIVRLLIKKIKSDNRLDEILSRENEDKKTALMLAIEGEKTEIVQILKDHGAR